jgi:hypothetical protein
MGWTKTTDPAATAEATGTPVNTLFNHGCEVVVVVVVVVVEVEVVVICEQS